MNERTDANGLVEPGAGEPSPFAEAKGAMLALLTAHKIVRVHIRYDGSGDSGQIDNITATDADGNRVPILSISPINGGASCGGGFASLWDALDDFAWSILGHYHDGFVDNDGGYGTFVIDVPDARITLDHYDRFVQSFNTETEL